ncbi:ribosomal-protein-alanine N-acetyltransferase RimI, partial [Halobium palmae]
MTTPATERDAPETVTIKRADQADLLAVFRIEQRAFSQPWPFTAFDGFVGEAGFLVATKPGDVDTAGSDRRGRR